jgi:hypothetical protein
MSRVPMAVPAFIVLSVVLASPASAQKSFNRISYSDWAALSGNARREIFVRLSNERKAEFTREHILRWRQAHGRELTDSQRRLIREMLEYVSPKMYDYMAEQVKVYGPYTNVLPQTMRDLFAEAQVAFSSQQIHELFFMNEADLQ